MADDKKWKCPYCVGNSFAYRSWLIGHVRSGHPDKMNDLLKTLEGGKKAPWQDNTGKLAAKANPTRVEKEMKRLKKKVEVLKEKRAKSKFVEDRMPGSMLHEWSQRSERLRNMANGLTQEADKIDALAAGLKKFIG